MTKTKSVKLFVTMLFASTMTLFTQNTSFADESSFGYLYTTDSLPKGQWEFEQHQTARSGKARGSYFSLDLKDEIEYGITDRLSGALYLKSGYLTLTDVYNPEDVSTNLPNLSSYDINCVSLEFKYRLLSPYTDALGLTVYFEPEMSIRDHMTGESKTEKSVEFRLIAQKNFFDDQLIFASNLMLEPEWEGGGAKELWFEWTMGSSYRFRENWSLGLEFRNHREYPNMDLGHQEHSAFFLGPNVHYGTQSWWATLTLLPQIVGSPQNLGKDANGIEIADATKHLGQHEKLEIRLKFGINL